jgi:uncharacterized protein YceK
MRWTSKRALIFGLLLAYGCAVGYLVVFGGCATILVRMQPEKPPPGVYPAVQFDAAYVIWEIGILGISPSPDSPPGFLQRTECIITGIVDLPVSLVMDTVCLPWDISRLVKSKNREKT